MNAIRLPVSFIAALVFLLSSYACSNPTTVEEDIPATSAVHIAVEGNPVLLIYDFDSESHNLNTTITLTETAGVSTTISSIALNFLQGGGVRESRTLSGGELAAKGKLPIAVSIRVSGQYDALRIEVGGVNANNQRITSSKSVDIEYVANLSGTYKGPVKGVLGARQFETTIILEIAQDGKILKGPWAQEEDGLSGVFTGRVVSAEFTAEMELITPCTGLIDAEADIHSNGISIQGSYKGTTYCLGDIEATFTVRRIIAK